MKVYTIPTFSRTLTKTLKEGNWKVVRNSKSVVTITRGGMLAMSFTMHLDFDAKRVLPLILELAVLDIKMLPFRLKHLI